MHDADGLDDETMLAFAIETKLSETCFVQTSSAPGADYRNRIFSMAGEMPFAGHPSLGTAVARALRHGVTGAAAYVQETGAGLQPIEVVIDGDVARASMLQEPAEFGPALDPEPLLDALGLSLSDAHPALAPQAVSTGLRHVMLPLASVDALARIEPNSRAVDAALAAHEVYGLYAFWCGGAPGTAEARLFARDAQVGEDPATGSAAGPLCAYLHRHAGGDALTITQGAALGRPSRLEAEMAGNRVRVAGAVVSVITGVLTL